MQLAAPFIRLQLALDARRLIAFLKFSGAVQEIFAVHALAGSQFTEIVDETREFVKTTFVLPDPALKDVRFAPRLRATNARLHDLPTEVDREPLAVEPDADARHASNGLPNPLSPVASL